MAQEQQELNLDRQESQADTAAAELSTQVWDELKTTARNIGNKVSEAGRSVAEQFGSLDFEAGSLYDGCFNSKHDLARTPARAESLPLGEIQTANPGDKAANPAAPGDAAAAPAAPGDRAAVPAGPAAFVGQEINRDVEPSTHTVAAGETLSRIARQHLGPDATNEEVSRHIKEIAQLNGIKDVNVIHPGEQFRLPGHTADGGTITEDQHGTRTVAWKDGSHVVSRADNTGFVHNADGTEAHWGAKPTDNFTVRPTDDGGREVTDFRGNKTTTWADGVERQENNDGTGHVRRPIDAGGGYTEHHWGSSDRDNYDLVKTGDGKYRIADGEGDRTGHEPANETERLQAERARLNDNLDRRLASDPETADRVNQDMAEFERRARQANPPLSDEEIAKTYSEVSKLLESTGEQPVSQADRVRLAEQVLHQAAHPNEVRQGFHGTCNVATIENRLYNRNPSDAARVVTEAATTGQVTMANGRVVPLPAGSLTPDTEGANHPSPDGQRSHASQIFQVAAVNSYVDRVNNSTTPAGQVRYEQDVPSGPGDTGERLWDYSTNPRRPAQDAAGNPLAPPNVPTSELQTISNDITGRNEQNFVLENGIYGDSNTVKVNNERELGERLAQMKRDGQLPAIIWVDAQNEPFFTDSGAGTNGGSGGAHVVTITDYDPETGRATVDNQWDQADDHKVSIHDLYRASYGSARPEVVATYQRDVAWDRAHGTEDGIKELELLRLQRNNGTLTDAQYDAQIIATMRAQEARWSTRGETYNGEQAAARAKYQQLLGFLPAARAQAIRTAVTAP